MVLEVSVYNSIVSDLVEIPQLIFLPLSGVFWDPERM